MTDYLLLFTDEATAASVMTQLAVTHDPANGVNVDVIGTVYDITKTSAVDTDGYPVYSSTARAGWHINVRSINAISWPAEYLVTPQTRVREWQ